MGVVNEYHKGLNPLRSTALGGNFQVAQQSLEFTNRTSETLETLSWTPNRSGSGLAVDQDFSRDLGPLQPSRSGLTVPYLERAVPQFH